MTANDCGQQLPNFFLDYIRRQERGKQQRLWEVRRIKSTRNVRHVTRQKGLLSQLLFMDNSFGKEKEGLNFLTNKKRVPRKENWISPAKEQIGKGSL